MSHSLPAPPPPLPLMDLIVNKSNAPLLNNITTISSPSKNRISKCLWALEYPEIQKSCFLARVCQVQPPAKCQYYNVASILQEGPTCGLTAVSMLMGGTIKTCDLLEIAKKREYTNNGEIFSAQFLCQLISDNLKVPLANAADNNNDAEDGASLKIQCHVHEGRLDCSKIKECLLAGACLFVPYDPDYNHAPCLKYGHKAHWALIVGYLISDENEFHILARHGKARNLAVWSLKALSESNANLIEFAQPKGYPDCDFLLPPGGIAGDLGLKERAIIVSGELPHETITIR